MRREGWGSSGTRELIMMEVGVVQVPSVLC